MQTKVLWPPPPDPIVSDLIPLSQLLYPSMDAATDHAVQYFEQNNWETIDPWLHAHIVRHYAGLRLKGDGIGSLGYRLHEIPFSGLLLEHNRYFVRILKVSHRVDPLTRRPKNGIQGGFTEARRQYFYQPSYEFEADESSLSLFQVPQKLRLVMLWDINEKGQLVGLELACPKSVRDKGNVVVTHWWVAVPDPRAGDQPARAPEYGKKVVLDDIEFPAGRQDRAAGDGDAGLR